LPLGDEFVQVVGLGRGQLAHGEGVEDEQVGADELADALVPGAVGLAAGELGEDAAGLGETTLAPPQIARWPRAWATCVSPRPVVIEGCVRFSACRCRVAPS
jgi:hypothetical protein